MGFWKQSAINLRNVEEDVLVVMMEEEASPHLDVQELHVSLDL